MNEKIDRSAPSLPVSNLLEIDKICRRFEDAWKAGQQPRLEEFVATASLPQRDELRRELQSIDAEYRKRAKPAAYDPYYQWLGIAPKDQPPNHYRLLGVDRFEENLDVIDNAADRQTAHLRTFQIGKYSDLSQRLLNEVAKAKICLLDPAKKAAYDAKLKQQLQPAQETPLAPGGRGAGGEGVAPPPPATPPSKNQLGEYQLLAKLGAGGMGTVYKARHTKLEKTVALKVLAKGSLVNDEAIARFDREMKAVGQLNHPNIVQAHDAREIAGTRFLVMEYVDGVDLAKLVDACGPLPVADACELIRQTALGLDHAHQRGLVHRDIKPANLMLSAPLSPGGRGAGGEGDQPLVKILDLGLAMFQPGQLAGVERITASGQAMGTIDYMAPEQALASRDVDIRADLYSLGCTLYKLLSGRAPFSGPKYRDQVNKLMAHAREPVPPIRKLRPDVPAHVAAVLDRLLAKDPAQRYATPAELLEAITPLAAGSNLRELMARARKSSTAPPAAAAAEAPSVHIETLSNIASQAKSITNGGVRFPGRPVSQLRAFILHPSSFIPSHVPGWALAAAGGGAALMLLAIVLYISTNHGLVKIELSDRNAKVEARVDGDLIQIAGIQDPLTLRVGQHGIEVKSERFETVTQSFTVQRDELAVVRVTLERKGEGGIAKAGGGKAPRATAGSSSSAVGTSGGQAASGTPTPPLAIAPFDAAKARQHQEAWAKHLGLSVEQTNSIGMKLTLIPPGEFDMGSTDAEIAWALREAEKKTPTDKNCVERVQREAPRHRVRITRAFYMGTFQVTQGDYYEGVVGGKPNAAARDEPGRRQPVGDVSWDDAVAFCRTLSAIPEERAAQRVYRLPTEAEWEYACRAGTTTRWYSGDDETSFAACAWFRDSAGWGTRPVGQKKPNAWGLFDMSGNVNQWCSDWFSPDYYKQSPVNDPRGPAAGSSGLGGPRRMLRGGFSNAASFSCRSASRQWLSRDFRHGSAGFRVTAEIAPAESEQPTSPAATASTDATGGPIAPPPAVAPFEAAEAKQHQDTWAKHLGVPVDMTNAVGMKLVLIPPGEFDMGSTPEEVATELEWSKKRKGFSGRIFTEGPRHRVKITKPLYFGMYHTTQAEYEKVMGVNPSAFTEKQMKGSAFTPPLTESLARYREMIGKKAKGTDTSRHPVDSATWDEAAEFCRKLSAMPAELAARRVYRLPTEAEWEYACRAGTTTRWYCGDDEADVVGAAWFKTNADGTTHPVGLKKANAWGLYDMHGNANQWCADWCGDDYYAHSPPSDPTGPPYGSTRVARGGAYLIEPSYFRSAARVHCGPASRWTHLGFRVVADIATTGQAQRKTADSRRDQMPLTPAVTQTVSPGKESVLGQVAVDLGDGVKLEMLWIPAGEFLMGSPDSDKDARPDEKPQHRVRITRPFYLGKYLVTQAQWQAVMGSDPSHVKGPKNPVEMVSWNDCQAFLDKLNTKSGGRGGKFQLPTDAQWEYACRAGSTTRYCFGDEESGLDEFAWYGNSGGRTHPVGEKKPNAWGLYDMHGNVWEWCGDWLDGGYYARSPVDDPMGPTRGSNRVIRGGGWNGGAGDCRSALRSGDEPGDRDGILGFRVARVPAEEAGSPRAAPAVLNTVIDSPPLAIAPFDAAKARQHQEAWAKHLGLPVEQTNSIGMQFVLIPPGEFDMGSSAEEVAWLSERGSRTKQRGPDFEPLPVVRVKISKPFNVGIYHVTQGEYAKVMGVNPSVFCTKPMEASAFNPPLPDFLAKSREEAAKKIEGDTSRHPVDSVSWDDCLEFCRRLSALPAERAAGRVYRLPTQAEWEYTCRAGTTSVWYCGNDEADLVECAWLGGTDSGGMAHPVGQKRPNAWGLYDMYGNVAQWCADWLIPGHHKRPPLVDPIGLTTGNGRATRGGYYQMAAISSRSALFHAFVPTLRLPSIGFRVVCEIATGRPATTDQGPGKSGTPNAGASPGNAASPFPNPESPIPRPAAATFGARGPVTSRSMFRLRTPPVAHASGRECAPVPTGTDEGVALGIFNRPVPEGRPKIAQHVSAG